MIKKKFWLFFFLFNLIILPGLFFLNHEIAQRKKALEKPLTVYGNLRPFRLTERNGSAFGLKDMGNRIWVANFMFTSCPNECPAMNFKMSLLQDSLDKSTGMLSFSVDPEKDTPAAL